MREALVQGPHSMSAQPPQGPIDHVAAAGLGPLDALQVRQVEQAGERMRKLRAAITVSRFNGIALWVCAVLFLPLSFFDASLLIAVALLALFGSAELHGGNRMRALDPSGARVLVINQIAVFVAIALYCVASIYIGLTGPNPYETLMAEYPDLGAALSGADAQQLEQLKGTVEGAYRASIVAFYLIVLGVAGIYQGLCALYYRARGAQLRSYVDETPEWIRELQRRLA